MDLSDTAVHKALRREVRDFLAAHGHEAPSSMAAGRPGKAARAWQQQLICRGYAARTVARAYGGFGAAPDVLSSRIIAEEFARAGKPMGFANQGVSMLVPTLLEMGTEEQKTRWIPPTLAGETVWCQGYSEPGAGSDLASLRTHARVEDDHFIINGQKIWTSTAHAAQMMFCLVRTEPDAPKHKGISYLLIPMDSEGIEVRPLLTMTGKAEFNEVFFTDVRVPCSAIVGGRGQGWQVANATLKHERDMLGDPNATQSSFAALVRLLREETARGRALLDNPAWRERLAALQGQVEAMRLHGLRLLTCRLKGEDPGVARMIVKLRGCELNHQISAMAIDALGEQGLLYEGDPRARGNGRWQWGYMFQLGLIIGGGTAQIQKNIIAERGLGMPRSPRPAPAKAPAKAGAR